MSASASASPLKRQNSGNEGDLQDIYNFIGICKLYIEKYIMMALDAHHEEKNKIKVNIFYNEANTAVFINLDFRGPFFLSFICYKTTYDTYGKIIPNRMECVIKKKINSLLDSL